MAERQTYKLNQAVQAVPIQGSQDVWKQVSATIGSFYDQYVAGEEALLKSQGRSAGLEAATGEKKKQITMLNAGTVYGQAFNDAAIKAYGASIEIDVKNSINEFAINNSENRDDFVSKVDTYRDEFVSGISHSTFKAIATNKIQEVSGVHEREIYGKWKEKQHLKNLVTTSENFDNSIGQAAVAGGEAVEKWHTAYSGANLNDSLAYDYDPEITIEHFTETFAEDFKKQFYKIDAQLDDMLAIPGDHFSEGVINEKKQQAILEIYQGVFLEEYKQAQKKGKGSAFKTEFISDPKAYINSQPHLKALFSKDILQHYPMTTTGTEDDPAMSDKIYEAMTKHFKINEANIKFETDKAEKELKTDQTNNFVDALNDLATGGNTTIEHIVEQQTANPNLYDTDDYKFLVNAITSGKYNVDDEEAVSELEFYLMTTTDKREQKMQQIREFSSQGRISWKTVSRLGKAVIEDTFGDITKGPDYQNAVNALKPHFQRTKTQYGQEATGQDKIWMNKAIIEMTARVEGGEVATDIYEEIAEKYVGLFKDNTPVGKELKQFYVGKGKDRKFDCAAAKKFVDARFLKHKNPLTYSQDLSQLNNRQCTYE